MIGPDGSVLKRDTTLTSNPSGNNGGNNTGGTTNSTSILPVSAGSVRNYSVTALGQSDELTITMTDRQATINGKVYSVANVTSKGVTVGSEYYHFSNNTYTWRDNEDVADVSSEMPILKEDAAVNSTWTVNLVSVFPGTTEKYVGILIAKDISYTVNGKAFSNVWHTRIEHQLTMSGQTTVDIASEYYFAKGIGIIENNIIMAGTVIGSQKIKSYNIK
ncbi:hypothetical protein GCM10028827_15140 [Mucilaginibacter myungsuensis]